MTPFEQTVSHITPQPTMVYGLNFFPSLEPHCSNDQDLPNWGWHTPLAEVTDCNLSVVKDVMIELGTKCQNILEIGVNRNDLRSMSQVLYNFRPKTGKYLGVDLDDKSYLDDSSIGIYTIKTNSHNQLLIRQKLAELGMQNIDLLFIDGWHSVNTCVNDWMYTDILSPHGVVILHDTNAHPGCVSLYHAVNENLFKKQRLCTNIDDHGISVFWKK